MLPFREYRRKRHKKKRAQAEVKLAQSQQGRFDVLKAELTKKLQLELEQSLLVGVPCVRRQNTLNFQQQKLNFLEQLNVIVHAATEMEGKKNTNHTLKSTTVL